MALATQVLVHAQVSEAKGNIFSEQMLFTLMKTSGQMAASHLWPSA